MPVLRFKSQIKNRQARICKKTDQLEGIYILHFIAGSDRPLHMVGIFQASVTLLGHFRAASPGRSWRGGLRRDRFRSDRTPKPGQGALGDVMALYAGRPGDLQGRFVFLQDRGGYERQA